MLFLSQKQKGFSQDVNCRSHTSMEIRACLKRHLITCDVACFALWSSCISYFDVVCAFKELLFHTANTLWVAFFFPFLFGTNLCGVLFHC